MKKPKNLNQASNPKKKKGIGITIGILASAIAGYGIYKYIKSEPGKYTARWFNQVSDDVLKSERELVAKEYAASGDDFKKACEWQNLLFYFDKIIRNREATVVEAGFPVHRENGWYLRNDD